MSARQSEKPITVSVNDKGKIVFVDSSLQAVEVTTFSSKSNEYYTPAVYVNAARKVMGSIDLDPASCEYAQATVKASTYYTIDDNGLEKQWHGNVWCNPPYGKIGNASSQGIWGERMLSQYEAGYITQGVLLVRAALGYEWFEQLWDKFPVVCFARERLSFISPGGKSKGKSKQGTAFFYVGSEIEKFTSIFSQFGRILYNNF